MTRNRVVYRILGTFVAAAAALLSSNAFPQAGTAVLSGMPAGQTSCPYSSIATLSNGQVTITCNVVSATLPGTVGFGSATGTATKSTAIPTFQVAIFRTGGSSGAVSGTVTSNTPAVCTVANGTVSFGDGVTTVQNVAVTPVTTGPCNLSFALASGSAAQAGMLLTTITIQDPVTVPPPPAGCEGLTPVANFQQFTSFGPAGQGTIFTGVGGMTYSWPLPKTTSGAQASAATIVHTMNTSTTSPLGLTLQWAISKCPGDFAYFTTDAAAYSLVLRTGTQKFYPCGTTAQGIESGGVKYNSAGATDICRVPTGETWYVNLRFVGGTSLCPSGKCNVTYSWW